MFSNFDFEVIHRTLPYVIGEGLRFTLTLTLMATVFGLMLGTALALMRLSPFKALSAPAALYVNLMRTLPLVLVIFWFYFLVPYIGQFLFQTARPMKVGAFASALITFSLFEAAYFSEIMRAGIQSVARGQVAAGLALGLTYRQLMQYVVVPQAVRNMLPVMLTQTIVLFQDTSLVYVISLTDLLGAAATVATRDGRLVEMYLFAALIYFVISFGASRLVRALQARMAVIR